MSIQEKRLLEELAKKEVEYNIHHSQPKKQMQSVQNAHVFTCASLAWLHCLKGCDNIKMVRMKEGGGIRLVDNPITADKTEVIKIARTVLL